MFKVTRGTISIPPRKHTCSNYVLESMEYAVGRMYVKNHFDSDSKKAATEMIVNIQNEFKAILNGMIFTFTNLKYRYVLICMSYS